MFRLAWRGKERGKTTVMSANKKPGRVQFKSRLKEVSIRFSILNAKQKACSTRKHSSRMRTTRLETVRASVATTRCHTREKVLK